METEHLLKEVKMILDDRKNGKPSFQGHQVIKYNPT